MFDKFLWDYRFEIRDMEQKRIDTIDDLRKVV
jgi:hypothetical protein